MKRSQPPPTYACQRCGGWFQPPPGRGFPVVSYRTGRTTDVRLEIWCGDCEAGRESPSEQAS
jgi:hypothetical protein